MTEKFQLSPQERIDLSEKRLIALKNGGGLYSLEGRVLAFRESQRAIRDAKAELAEEGPK